MKRIGIMQPYFLPYIGYFQLISAVDEFVVYDNIKYTKKGWINRNRILLNGAPQTISLPLKAGSDALAVDQRALAAAFDPQDLLKSMQAAYRMAPCFEETLPVVQSILELPGRNLFEFIFNSISVLVRHLAIRTPLIISSSLPMDHQLKGSERVLEICRSRGAKAYVNAIGGIELYDPRQFKTAGIDLRFLKSRLTPYPQGGHEFVPALSIVDVLFHLGAEKTRWLIDQDFVVGTADEFGRSASDE